MKALFDAARFSEASEIYEDAVSRSRVASNEAQLLQARTLLKRDSRRAASFLTKLRLAKPTAVQTARAHLYLGTAYARLREFGEADRHFDQARPTLIKTDEAEFANHLARRYLLASDTESAMRWFEATLSDRSKAGKIKSTHLLSIVESQREQYVRQGEELVALLNLIGNDRLKYAEDWYLGLHTLAVLGRELPVPKFGERAQREVDVDVPWAPDFLTNRFQALKAVAWCRALDGDQLSCLRYLRRAQVAAPSDVWRAVVHLDTAFFALTMSERRWAENEFALAEELAEPIEWEDTPAEERVALLLLAELANQFDEKRARYYLARFKDLGRIKSSVHHIAFDHRLQAMADYAAGIIERDSIVCEEHLRSAWSTFDRIRYDVRAGRAAAALFRLSARDRWRVLAEDKFEQYPRSWLHRELASVPAGAPGSSLTPMQDKIVRLVREGLSTDAIAERMGRSRNTVLNHLKLVYKKLSVNSREALVAEALRRGIVQ